MFNIGFTEMLAIAVIALVFIGPKQLPQIARTMGRLLGQFRRLSSDFQREIYRAEDQVQTGFRDIEKKMQFSEPPTFEVDDEGNSRLKIAEEKPESDQKQSLNDSKKKEDQA